MFVFITKRINPILWALLIFFLPITSMPVIVRLAGSNTVGAFSGFFLALLVISCLIPHLLKGGRLPGHLWPIFGFVLAALISTLMASFNPIPLYKEYSFVRNEITSLITLSIGIAFYMVTTTWVNTTSRLRTTLQILNWGGLMLLLVAGIQAFSWYTSRGYPEWMRDFHNLYSVGPLFRQRPTGMSYEPSWLAHQLNMLYLPYWLSATITKRSAHIKQIAGITFENVLLVGGITLLILTLSRVGLIAFLLMVSYIFLIIGLKLVKWLNKKIHLWYPDILRKRKITRFLSWLLISSILMVVLITIVGSLLLGLSRLDRRMADIFAFNPGQENGFIRFAENLEFGSRIIYWQAGWDLFSDYPWLGVGLGNTGFYFPDKISSYGWKIMEVREYLFRLDILPNLKSLWVRILAETGVLGFSMFITWLYILWQAGRDLSERKFGLDRVVGLAGQLAILALLAEGFSIDTFALPYFWICFGLVTARTSLLEMDKNEKDVVRE